jgi:hypothetical protein
MSAFSGTQLVHKTKTGALSVSQQMQLCERKMDRYEKMKNY